MPHGKFMLHFYWPHPFQVCHKKTNSKRTFRRSPAKKYSRHTPGLQTKRCKPERHKHWRRSRQTCEQMDRSRWMMKRVNIRHISFFRVWGYGNSFLFVAYNANEKMVWIYVRQTKMLAQNASKKKLRAHILVYSPRTRCDDAGVFRYLYFIVLLLLRCCWLWN